MIAWNGAAQTRAGYDPVLNRVMLPPLCRSSPAVSRSGPEHPGRGGDKAQTAAVAAQGAKPTEGTIQLRCPSRGAQLHTSREVKAYVMSCARKELTR
jgi:hypothetical protein